jgi:hypothetical protein
MACFWRWAGCLVVVLGMGRGVGQVASSEALRNGTITFWASSREPFGGGYLAEMLRESFPGVRVDWRWLAPQDLLPALAAARAGGTRPDVVYVESGRESGPLEESGTVLEMPGWPRLGPPGRWLALKDARNEAEAKAFLVWMRQPLDRKVRAAKYLHAADEAEVRRVATAVIVSMGSWPAVVPRDLLDPEMAEFPWDRTRLPLLVKGSVRYTASLAEVDGRDPLAFVVADVMAESDGVFGVTHAVLALRKDGERWKVVGLFPGLTVDQADRLFGAFGGVAPLLRAGATATTVTLLTPDGEKMPRFPKGEIEFQIGGGRGVVQAVEAQFSDMAGGWSVPGLVPVRQPVQDGTVKEPTPFGAGRQPHRWRVWSVGVGGELTISEWRTVDFTN